LFPRSPGTRPFAAWATRGSLGTRAQQEEATRSSLGTQPVDFWPLGLKFSLGFLRRPGADPCKQVMNVLELELIQTQMAQKPILRASAE